MPSGRKYINRRAKDYHIKRINCITELDKVASFLLAISYSRRASPTKISQGLIQMDCVAVAYVNSEWIFSSNNRTITDGDIQELANELGIDMTYAIACRGDGTMHAEMQVLEEIVVSHYSPENVFFGVSKPCCERCAMQLDKVRALYTNWHSSKVVHWEKPFFN